MAGFRLTLTTALAAALVASSCSQPDSGFDMGSLVDAIPAALVPDDPSSVTDVSCPEPLTSEATSIRCAVTITDREVEVVADIAGDGTVNVSTDAILLDLLEVAVVAGERLSADLGVESTVTCDDTVAVVVPNDTVGCTATENSGIEHRLVVTIVDDAGNWSLDLER